MREKVSQGFASYAMKCKNRTLISSSNVGTLFRCGALLRLLLVSIILPNIEYWWWVRRIHINEQSRKAIASFAILPSYKME
jgi:hypothetical protein